MWKKSSEFRAIHNVTSEFIELESLGHESVTFSLFNEKLKNEVIPQNNWNNNFYMNKKTD